MGMHQLHKELLKLHCPFRWHAQVSAYQDFREFIMSLSDDKQADIIDAFNTTSRYLDDTLNIHNVCFDTMVSQIYPSELQLNKANTKAAF